MSEEIIEITPEEGEAALLALIATFESAVYMKPDLQWTSEKLIKKLQAHPAVQRVVKTRQQDES